MSQSVTFNLELKITVSIGEPQITIQAPQYHVQHIPNPNVRTCARCATNYRETAVVWPQYPMCPYCVREQEAEYQRELQANSIERARRIQAQNREQQNSDWKEDGF